jgi:peptidylprolyl isomerase
MAKAKAKAKTESKTKTKTETKSNTRTETKPGAQNGDTVTVHYTGAFEDGTVFDTSTGRDPMEFTIGEGSIIRGFERAVVGMVPGESKSVTISVEEGYGPRRKDLVAILKRSELPADLDPEVGETLELRQEKHVFPVTVIEVSEQTITMDANHPLAGEILVFDIELLTIK